MASELQKIVDLLITQITGGKGIAVRSFGSKLIIENVATPAPQGMEAYHFEVDTVYADYLVARHVTGDGTEINSTTYNIAKPSIQRGDTGTYSVGDILLAVRSVESTGVEVDDQPLHWEAIQGPLAAASGGFKVGMTMVWWEDTPPTGWLELNEETVGDASSGASARANADCENIFKYLWDADDVPGNLTISGGKGASAAADWAAHKTITLPDSQRRRIIGRGTSTWDDMFKTDTEDETDREPESHQHASGGDTDSEGANLGATDISIGQCSPFATVQVATGTDVYVPTADHLHPNDPHNHDDPGHTHGTSAGGELTKWSPYLVGVWIINYDGTP